MIKNNKTVFTEQAYCPFCKRTKPVSEFEEKTDVEMPKYRLSWFIASLLLCKEWYQGWLIEADEEKKWFYKNGIKMFDDILKIVNKISDTEPIVISDIVRISLNKDQNEWLRDLFSRLLEREKKRLNDQRRERQLVISIVNTEGSIDMIKYFLKTIDIRLECVCTACMIENDPNRPKVREWNRKERHEFK